MASSVLFAAAAPLQGTMVPVDPSPTDVLTRRLAEGDEAAFREFHAQYFDRLLRYHLLLARGDEHAARDALQETLTRVARKGRHFESEDAFWCWLAVIARSTAVDGGRRRQRYWATLKRYTLGWMQSSSSSPEENHSDSGLLERLDQGLATLEPADRQLVEAKYLAGKSVREMSVSEKAIESRLLRLRRQLRESILRDLRHEQSL
jgi:RNA polymerase sigma-70 factor (ECF subfamily)